MTDKPDPADTSYDVEVPVYAPDGTLLYRLPMRRRDWERLQAQAAEQGVDPGEIIHRAIKAADRMTRLLREGRQINPRLRGLVAEAAKEAWLHQEAVYRERRARGLPVEEWERRPGRDD